MSVEGVFDDLTPTSLCRQKACERNTRSVSLVVYQIPSSTVADA